MVIILTKDVYTDLTADEGELKEALRLAMANLTMAKQLIFDVVSKRKDDVDIYKHEQESMRRSYIENYYNAMDTVIQLLDNSQTVPSWKETRYKKMLDVLKIKSTEEFDMLYTIDMSYLSFSGPYRSRAKRWMTGYRPILNGQRKRRRYCARSNDASPSRP